MTRFHIWWLAIRPKTLSISITPVLLGSVLSWHSHQQFSLLSFSVILLAAVAIQIGTNLYNDAADYEKGADTETRLGPQRAAQQGWLSAAQIKKAAFISFVMAFIAGIYLVYLGGVAIIFLGLLSILCGYAYTGGPKPIAYSPFGELFVLLFFGFAAVGGTYYLQSQSINTATLLLASSIGSLAAAILLINNYRDLEGDEQVSKLTLVHYSGRAAARKIYTAMLIYPYILLGCLWPEYSLWLLLPLFSLPAAIALIFYLYSLEISAELNKLLARTALLQLVYTLLLSLGIWLSPLSDSGPAL